MASRDENTFDETTLITRIKEGDHEAFSIIVRQYKDRVFNTVVRYLRNYAIAEEVTQDVFITVYRKIGTFEGRSKFSTWLYRIAVNHAKNRIGYLKRRGYYRSDELHDYMKIDSTEHFSYSMGNPVEHSENKELMSLLIEKMEGLAAKDREIIILKDFEGLSYEEIAEILKISLGTVKSRLSRARHRLKEEMDDYLS
jgi:RNA polymerase sigma-70 factor (ECF subfamily)